MQRNDKIFEKMKIDKKLIKELVENLKEFNLTELEYQEGQTKIKVSKALKGIESSKTSAVVSPNKSVLKNSDDSNGVRVKSPIIGTAYLAPEPGAKKFIEVGDKVKKGQTVMIVEAMKTMNHVPSTSDGVVKKILVEDSQPVEFGQTLVILN
jgi:acetyl-CoA carboxylase biotin carboxyl carrier protein